MFSVAAVAPASSRADEKNLSFEAVYRGQVLSRVSSIDSIERLMDSAAKLLINF